MRKVLKEVFLFLKYLSDQFEKEDSYDKQSGR